MIGAATATMHSGQIAIVGNPYSGLAPEEFVRMVTDVLGLSAVDLSLLNLAGRDVHAYADLLARHGVTVHTVSVAAKLGRLGVPGTRTEVDELLLRAIGHAAELGAGFVQFHTVVGDHTEQWGLLRRLAAHLEPALEAASEAGVTLVLENNFDQRDEDRFGLNPARRPETTLAFLDLVGNDQLKIAFDPCNAYIAGVEVYPYAYELLTTHVVSIHVKDCMRYSPLLHGDREDLGALMQDSLTGAYLPVPVGEGAVPWESLLRRLRADGFDGWLTLEPMPVNGSRDDWCRASLEFLKPRLDEAPDGPRPCSPRTTKQGRSDCGYRAT